MKIVKETLETNIDYTFRHIDADKIKYISAVDAKNTELPLP